MFASTRHLPRGAVLAASVTTILMIALAVISSWSVDAFIDESRSVSDSHKHLTQFERLISSLEDAETANRGFVLTGQDDYLQQYEAALSDWSVQYDRLLNNLPIEERDRLLALRPDIVARLDRLRQGLSLAVTDRDRARTFIENGDGKELMDRIHAGVDGLEGMERATMARRETGFTSLARLVKLTDLIGGTLAIGIVLASTWAISWQWRRRVAAEHSVRAANERLEADVEERTAALATANARLLEQAKDLERSNQELESFSYSVSHDLRAPLRVIDGLSGILLKKAGDRLDEQSRSTLDLVIANARRMRDLIDDMLAFSRLGFQEIVQEPVDMDQLVADCWSASAPERVERPVAIVIDPLPPCRGDAKLLRQVVLNLLSNALKYSRTKPETRIHVQAQRTDGLVEYSVTDNGVGFNMAAADKLFGVFQRLHSESEFEGTGIGLAICRRIVERHGGSIWAESVIDIGTTFHFTVPAWIA